MDLYSLAYVLDEALQGGGGNILVTERLPANGHSVVRVKTDGGDFVIKRYDKTGFFADRERVGRCLLGNPDGFRRLRYEGEVPGVGMVAVYDFVAGKLLADMTTEELELVADRFAAMLCEVQVIGSKAGVNGFGPVLDDGTGQYPTHEMFVQALSDFGKLDVGKTHESATLALEVLVSTSEGYAQDPTCVLIGNNMRNLLWAADHRPMLLDSGGIAYGDPLMFFGSLLAVTYGTSLWQRVIERVAVTGGPLRRVYCYGALLAQNIVAFITLQGSPDALETRPWASPNTFGEIMTECLRQIEELK